ncbi:MAG TPA: T9SS type A sorting domain-containing protein, partial [Gaiellales bacterium]|nr:T9SS type A sorting domain-containing protein [Gaiellales bacterium]
WNPAPNGAVTALEVSSGTVIVAGSFTTIAGVNRGRGAVIASSGAVGSWNPGADGPIDAFAQIGATLYVGGTLGSLAGLPRSDLGAVNLANAVTDWVPQANNTVHAMVATGSVVWVGGSFTEVAGMPQAHLARLLATTALASTPPIATGSQGLALELRPNPTRGELLVRYTVPVGGHVRIGVYDVMGRRIGPVVDRVVEPGPHESTWDAGRAGADRAPGLYFVRMDAAGQRLSKRFVIVR